MMTSMRTKLLVMDKVGQQLSTINNNFVKKMLEDKQK